MSDCAPSQPPELARSFAGRGSSPSLCSAELRRKSKLMAATVIATMLNHWMCDGYAIGDDSDEYDPETFRAEVLRFQRLVNARVRKLSS